MRIPPPAEFLESLPSEFRDTPYVYERFPGAPGVSTVQAGANCQLYAYEVLRLFGYDNPPLRSSDLWTDTEATLTVSAPQPLDLVLFGRTADAYGAHVGLSLGEDQILHLSAQVGRPAVWDIEQFQIKPEYRVLIGIKRPLRVRQPPP